MDEAVIICDHFILSKRTHNLDCSQRQMSRNLKSLSKTSIVGYSLKNIASVEKDLVLKIDFLKLNSAGSSYVEYHVGGHVCQSRMHTYKEEYRSNKEKNKERDLEQSNSFNENSKELDQLVEKQKKSS